MTGQASKPFQTEITPDGEQSLVPGVKPITAQDRLNALMSAPLVPTRAQKPIDIGLFDENARNQMSLF